MITRTRLILVALALAFPGLMSPPTANAGDIDSLVVSDLDHGVTAANLVNDLVGSGVTISNVTFTGNNRAAGRFTGGTSIVGFDSGLVLSSGKVQSVEGDPACGRGVEGPNNCHEQGGASGNSNSTSFGTAGDPDLTALAGFPTFDAAVLEFDFVPDFSTVSFQYVFSSDEYSDYANTSFNDVFAFFVNGVNCAIVPGTTQPVSINTINNGNDSGGDPTPHHAEFFRDNVRPSVTINIQQDGLTVVLTCTAQVNPGTSNHMKLAIADSSDTALDTAVFLKAQSLVSGTVVTTTLSGGGQSGTMITVPAGTAIVDSAFLNGPNAESAGGTVNYKVYSDANCNTQFADAGTKNVTNGQVPDSDPITFNQAGTFYWRAFYSGDDLNNASSSGCGEETVTVTEPPGPVSPYYLTSGQQGLTSVVQFDSLVNAWIQHFSNFPGEYPISVLDRVRTMGSHMDSYVSKGSDYTLGGIYLGHIFPYALPSASFFDGGTDGNFNYSVDYTNGGVYKFSSSWGNPVLLFNTAAHYLGITVAFEDGGGDSPTGSLPTFWISKWDTGVVEHRGLNGSLISSFTVPFNRISCLAWDSADGTLWMGSQSTLGTFYQYATDGTLIRTRFYSALTSQNTLGGEFRSPFAGAPASPPPPTTAKPNVTVTASPASTQSAIQEGDDGIFVITRSNVSSQPLTVSYTMSGTARLGTDYTLSNTTGNVTIPAGATSANVVVHSLEDSARESNETVIMTLRTSAAYRLTTPKATAKISDP